MNFVKRALLNVVRKKGKSLILFAVILILGNLISGAISIQQATNNVEKTIKEQLGTRATLEIDYEELDKLYESGNFDVEIQPLDLDTIHQVGNLSYVKYYDFNLRTYIGSDSMQSYLPEDMEDHYYHDGISQDFHLFGVNYPSVLDFEEGKTSLVDGRVFTADDIDNGAAVAIISQKLADRNDLQIGDTFALTNYIFDYSDMGGEELFDSRDLVLEVIGLFENNSVSIDQDSEFDGGMFDFMDMDVQNTVYLPNPIVSEELLYQHEKYMELYEDEMNPGEEYEYTEYFTPIIVLNSPDDTEAFREEVLPMLPELYTVIQSSDQYDSIAGPVQSMSTLSGYVLIVSVIATILIIGLVVLLFLRDRKKELGIYLSLGERRSRVVGQVMIEVMVIAVIGITLSLFTGNLLAQGVSETLMDANQNDEYYYDHYYYGMDTDVTTEDVVEAFEVKLDGGYIGMFYGIGLLTILFSTAIPLIYIVRLNPRKIMM